MTLSLGELETLLIGRTLAPPQQTLDQAGWSPESNNSGWASCPRCGSSAGPHEADMDGCARCRTRRLQWDRSVRLGVYEGVLREQVLLLKYSRWRPAGVVLGRLLGSALAEAMAREGVDPHRAVLIPAPMSWRRRTSRGLDHALVIATAAASVLGCPVMRALRRQHGPAQASLPASRRRSNMTRTMRARTAPDRDVAAVVVVDDIRTTGATLTECWRALHEAGGWPGRGSHQRWVATLAVVESGTGR